MRRIERKAPFEALRMWRRDDVVQTVERERAEAARKAETQQRSSWFSWRRSSKTEDAFEDDGADEGDVTTDDIEALLERDDEGHRCHAPRRRCACGSPCLVPLASPPGDNAHEAVGSKSSWWSSLRSVLTFRG